MSGVDVVVPCYNYARFLPRCVNSIVAQQDVDVRVLIVDDASSDDTPQVGQHLAALDPRVEFLRHNGNQGHIATFNEGLLGWASAKYSLLLSADDMLAPGALARAARLMDRHDDVGMTYGMAQIIEGDADPCAATEPNLEDYQIISGPRLIQRFCTAGNVVPTPTAVVRTELQQRRGGYRAELLHTSDIEMWMRFAIHASVGVLRSVQAYYRQHDSNMSLQFNAGLLGDRRERLQACTEMFRRWGQRTPELADWLQIMSRRLA